ncbi:MAG TPA: hypothetical protein VFE33_30245 [Thermoanaerobaculia bacterium]|nr:hypothetical protein [Thermoanaerobaculia bacterium]
MWRKKTAPAIVLAALLGLIILPPPAGAQPLGGAPASLWQQAWVFLFGGRLASLWGEDGSGMDPNGQHSTSPPTGGLLSPRGEDGICMDPNGRPASCAQAGSVLNLWGEDGVCMDPDGRTSPCARSSRRPSPGDAGRRAFQP